MENIVMTGVTSGFGIDWLYGLDANPEVTFFLLVRNKQKYTDLIAEQPLNNKAHIIECDLRSFDAIRAAVDHIKQLTDTVDTLVNNAGLWSDQPLSESIDNIESTLAVNHLAPYLLTGLLLPLLELAMQPRIINTASFRHKDANIDTQDIQLRLRFNAEQAYCNSKLYSVLFTQKLTKVLANTHIEAVCFDPGIVDTPMLRQGFPKSLVFVYPLFKRLIARSPAKGAETGIYLSNKANQIKNGGYYKDINLKNTSQLAKDPAIVEWLWKQSEKLSRYTYPVSQPV